MLPEDAFAALDQGRRAAAAAAESGILLDGFQPPAQALYPMFPDEEEQLMMEYTKYGVVDTELLGAINTAAAAAEGEGEQHLGMNGLECCVSKIAGGYSGDAYLQVYQYFAGRL